MADVNDILQKIMSIVSGSQYGASSDPLEAALARQRQNAMGTRGMDPSQGIIDRAASARVDAMGVNPYSMQGQAMSMLMSSAYNFFPDLVGRLIGVPDSGGFYRQIANGARGINMAHMGMNTSIMNPYSTQLTTERSMKLADIVYKLAIGGNGTGGYNVGFTNGLNMTEVGTVAQRMLSADFMYKGEDGRRLDTTSDEFRDKLEKLGAKFNAAASSLAKVTGSVSEALRLMDRMAGGNFLGGTEYQAKEVADKARSMSAAIRVTSAMAGMSPQEMYRDMTKTHGAIVDRYGVRRDIADGSGFSDMMLDPAFMSTMSYGVWAANNPRATQTQKSQALLATRYRSALWANSSAENMAAIVSYFTEKGLINGDMVYDIETALETGNANDVVDMVKSAVGEDVYHEMMSDPGALMAARMNGNRNVYDRLGRAGVEGNLRQAANGGTKRLTAWTMSRTDEQLDRLTGRSGNRRKARERAVADELRKEARYLGLAGGDDWDVNRLRRFFKASGAHMDQVDAVQHRAEINAQIKAVEESTLDEGELAAAKQALIREIDNSVFDSDEKKRLKDHVTTWDGSLGSFLEKELIGRQGLSAREARDMRLRVTGGKLFKDTARDMIRDLETARREWADPGEKEEKWARQSLANVKAVANEAAIQRVFAGSEFNDAGTDRDRMNLVRDEVKRLKDEGLLGDDVNIDVAENEAYRMMVDEALGGRIGDLSKDDEKTGQKYSEIVAKVAAKMMDAVNSGGSVKEGFAAGMTSIRDMVTGDGGTAQVDKFIDEGSDKVSSKNLSSKMASAVGRMTKEGVEQGRIKLKDYQVERLARTKLQLDNAAFAASGPEGAVLAQVAAAFEKGGGTAAIAALRENGKNVSWLEGLGLADVVEDLQRTDADNQQNALVNAMGTAEGKHAKAAIQTSKNQLDALSSAIADSGLRMDDLKKIVEGRGSAEEQSTLDDIMAKAGWETDEQKAYGRAYIKGLGANMEGGLGVLYDEGKRKAAKDSKNDDKWAEVTKGAAAAASPQLFEITELLRGILAFLGTLFRNPMRVAMSGIGGVT